MSFLVSLYLAGLAAIALPVVFHLIQRRPRGRLDFSSLMFLAPSPPRLTRKSRVSDWLLLILRGTAVALLALAFARPLLRESVDVGIEDQVRRRVAILVDTSASMQRADVWPQVRREVETVLDDLGPGDEAALYAFDAGVRRLVPFDDANPVPPAERAGQLRAAIARLRPGWGPSDLGAALAAVADDLDDTGDSDRDALVRRQIVLVSDLQEGSSRDALDAYQWPADVQLIAATVTSRGVTNAGLHPAPLVAEDTNDAGESVRVRVTNDRGSQVEQFELAWLDNRGNRVPNGAVQAYVPPGESRVVRVPRPAKAPCSRLALAGDDHDYDNVLYVAAPFQQQFTVLYVGNDAADDVDGLRYYLDLAWVETSTQKITIVSRRGDETLAEEDLAARLVIVADGVADAAADSLASYMERGGTVLYVLRDAAAQGLGRLLGRDDVKVAEAAVKDYVQLGQVSLGHPLFAPLADPRYSDFSKIHFWKHRSLELPETLAAEIPARFDDGSPAMIEVPRDAGRLVMFTSGWHPADSQLARSSKFVPLLTSILERTGVAAEAIHSYEVGQPQSPSGGAAGALTRVVYRTDGKTAAADARDGPDRPGIYRLTVDGKPREIAVNVPAAESRVSPIDIEDLQRQGVALGRSEDRAVALERRRQMRDRELEGRQKLWQWLVLATAVVLVGETWLAGRSAHRLAAPQEAAS